MDGIPVAPANTTPVPDTVASDVLLLLHVPPAGLEDNADVLPGHADAVPVIADGIGLTV